jgi:hypothetical protein
VKNDRTLAGQSERRKIIPVYLTAPGEPWLRQPQRGYQLTRHAQRRSSQRGIRDIQIQLIQLFGVDHVQKGGSVLSFIPERLIHQLRSAIDRCDGVSIIKADDESVVTVMHLDRRVATTEWSA